VAATPGGPARLTVDDGLYVQPASDYALVDARLGGERILPNQVILELKYRGALPDIFRELILTFGLTWQSTSKYRLGMMALGHRPDAREPHEPDELVLEN
jgi:hypothetical protein